ncbi:MAG: ATP-binding cassette domain-containing protein [Alphaproteobacteria bacterium]|nr:ATP-binding cassette domain-containing protein [Alphaproteobacteria bacterium]
MNQAAPILSMRHVGINYNASLMRRPRHDFWALKDVSLTLHRGESLGVIGRNGMGKSTLLRTMSGILKPDKGQFSLQKDATAALLSLQVGFVPHLSGRENIFLSGLLLGMRYQQIEEVFSKIITFAELENAIEKPISTYSDGMKARLGFAVSFQLDPDILLVDEVLGVGDAAFREKSSEMMKRRIHSDRTVVLVSHNANTIRELCERCVWIEEGVTVAEGPTDEIMRDYQNYVGKRANR